MCRGKENIYHHHRELHYDQLKTEICVAMMSLMSYQFWISFDFLILLLSLGQQGLYTRNLPDSSFYSLKCSGLFGWTLVLITGLHTIDCGTLKLLTRGYKLAQKLRVCETDGTQLQLEVVTHRINEW